MSELDGLLTVTQVPKYGQAESTAELDALLPPSSVVRMTEIFKYAAKAFFLAT